MDAAIQGSRTMTSGRVTVRLSDSRRKWAVAGSFVVYFKSPVTTIRLWLQDKLPLADTISYDLSDCLVPVDSASYI